MPRYVLLVLRERFPRLAASQVGLGPRPRRGAEQIRRLALDLAGGFTKAAQIGGARADVLPAPFIDALSQFHDAVPPRPFASLRGQVEQDLGRPLESVFAWVEPQALAAASLAQVHRARLLDGSEVVIKIQYPEIRRIIPLDLGMLRTVVGLIRVVQRRIDLRSLVGRGDALHRAGARLPAGGGGHGAPGRHPRRVSGRARAAGASRAVR